MEEVIIAVVTFVVGLGEQFPWLGTLLAIVGGIYVALMLLQVPVLAAAKLTKTQKDDAFLAKLYDFLTDWGPCFAPVAAVFKKKAGIVEPSEDPEVPESEELEETEELTEGQK